MTQSYVKAQFEQLSVDVQAAYQSVNSQITHQSREENGNTAQKSAETYTAVESVGAANEGTTGPSEQSPIIIYIRRIAHMKESLKNLCKLEDKRSSLMRQQLRQLEEEISLLEVMEMEKLAVKNLAPEQLDQLTVIHNQKLRDLREKNVGFKYDDKQILRVSEEQQQLLHKLLDQYIQEMKHLEQEIDKFYEDYPR